MNDGLETMIEVGHADARIFDLTLRLRRFPERVAEARRHLDIEEQQLAEVQDPWEQMEHEIQEREAASRIAQETVEKFEEHMKRVTTQKEYMAARKQVDEAKRLDSRLQDEIIERRVKQEELAPTLEERRERHNRVLEAYREEEAVILKEEQEIKAEIAQHEEVVTKGLTQLNERMLAHYQRMVKANRLPAIAPVVSGSCSGCRMTLPPQVFNQLIANNGSLFTCPTCQRLIYHEPPQESSDESDDSAESAPAAAAG